MSVKPAMTTAEWAGERDLGGYVDVADGVIDVGPGYGESAESRDSRMHALAALLLHEQPFGFTREDVGLLRKYADLVAERGEAIGIDLSATIKHTNDLADRIEALLPPDGILWWPRTRSTE